MLESILTMLFMVENPACKTTFCTIPVPWFQRSMFLATHFHNVDSPIFCYLGSHFPWSTTPLPPSLPHQAPLASVQSWAGPHHWLEATPTLCQCSSGRDPHCTTEPQRQDHQISGSQPSIPSQRSRV